MQEESVPGLYVVEAILTQTSRHEYFSSNDEFSEVDPRSNDDDASQFPSHSPDWVDMNGAYADDDIEMNEEIDTGRPSMGDSLSWPPFRQIPQLRSDEHKSNFVRSFSRRVAADHVFGRDNVTAEHEDNLDRLSLAAEEFSFLNRMTASMWNAIRASHSTHCVMRMRFDLPHSYLAVCYCFFVSCFLFSFVCSLHFPC